MSEMNLKPSLVPIRVEAVSLRSKIIDSIRHAIEHGVLKPGTVSLRKIYANGSKSAVRRYAKHCVNSRLKKLLLKFQHAD